MVDHRLLKYNIKELRLFALEHTINECAEKYDTNYHTMAQVLSRHHIKHKVQQVNNYSRGTKLHCIWKQIKQRCYNKNNKNYKNYGGRGIKVCTEWQGVNGFLNFKSWSMNNGYKEGLSIDRINNDGNYEPANCRWVTDIEQANNKRQNVIVEYKGERKTLAQWSRDLNIPYSRLQTRHYKGYSDKEIIEGKKKTIWNGRRKI